MVRNSVFKQNILAKQVAVVTGGGSGIGLEISRQLGIHGCRIVIMGRNLFRLESAQASLQKDGVAVSISQGDVRHEQACTKAVEFAVQQYGKLDVLVNAAAGNFLVSAEKLSSKGFKTVMDIDTAGTFNMCLAAYPYLSPGGLIINITATLQRGATWWQAHASAAKSAIDSLTRSLALEWGDSKKIRVVGIAPGPIKDTPGLSKLAPTATVALMKAVPVGRLGEPWDIAMMCVYLASEAGTFISGDVLTVDGANWLYRDEPMVQRQQVEAISRQLEKKQKQKGKFRSRL